MNNLTFSPSRPGLPGSPNEPWEINTKTFRCHYIQQSHCISLAKRVKSRDTAELWLSKIHIYVWQCTLPFYLSTQCLNHPAASTPQRNKIINKTILRTRVDTTHTRCSIKQPTETLLSRPVYCSPLQYIHPVLQNQNRINIACHILRSAKSSKIRTESKTGSFKLREAPSTF